MAPNLTRTSCGQPHWPRHTPAVSALPNVAAIRRPSSPTPSYQPQPLFAPHLTPHGRRQRRGACPPRRFRVRPLASSRYPSLSLPWQLPKGALLRGLPIFLTPIIVPITNPYKQPSRHVDPQAGRQAGRLTLSVPLPLVATVALAVAVAADEGRPSAASSSTQFRLPTLYKQPSRKVDPHAGRLAG